MRASGRSTVRSLTLSLVAAIGVAVGILPSAAAALDPAMAEAWRGVVSTDGAGFRCPVPSHAERAAIGGWSELPAKGLAADCSAVATNPSGAYEPAEPLVIPVVVHVLMDSSCGDGAISDAQVASQIEILNEDFRALFGTPGGGGYDSMIHFALATLDPNDQPTTGITRHCNTTWFDDGGSYWTTLAWDPDRYMNVYTNTADGALGYVPFLPADGGGIFVGQSSDRVVVLWETFGRDAPLVPYDQGRTATHEVGHYLGLEHTFSGGCGTSSSPGCYTTGDLICDTNAESSERFGCAVGATSCGSPDPIDNYMDYSDDLCMERFTQEQVRRVVCTLRNYRPELAQSFAAIFADGFESGDTAAW